MFKKKHKHKMLQNCICREAHKTLSKPYDELYHMTKYKLPRQATAFTYLQRISLFISNFMFEWDEIRDLSKMRIRRFLRNKNSCLRFPLPSFKLTSLECLSGTLSLSCSLSITGCKLPIMVFLAIQSFIQENVQF